MYSKLFFNQLNEGKMLMGRDYHVIKANQFAVFFACVLKLSAALLSFVMGLNC